MDYLVYLQILISLIMFAVVIKRYRDSRRPPPTQAVAPVESVAAEPLKPEEAHDPGRNWRQTPPPPPAKIPWWRLYSVTVLLLGFGVTQTGHHVWFVRSNPPPMFEALQMQRVEVLGWQRAHPQLHVRLPNGSSRMMEFPTFHYGKRGDRYYVLSFEEQRQLVGQTCQIWGRPLRFSIQDSYQVFAMECDKGGRLNFDKALKYYQRSFISSTSSTFVILIPGWIFVLILGFWLETSRNRKDRLALQARSSASLSSKAQP